MLKTFFQIILFIPFAVFFLLFVILGRLSKRLEEHEFRGKKTLVALVRSFSFIGVVAIGWIGKVYE